MNFLNKLLKRSKSELEVIKIRYEKDLDKSLLDHIKKERTNGTPDLLLGMCITSFASEYWREKTLAYDRIYESGNSKILPQEYQSALTKSTGIILKKYLDVVPPPFSEYL